MLKRAMIETTMQCVAKTGKGNDMLIFAVRHGQTDWNNERRFQGQTDIPLNGTGLAQAQALGACLSQLHPARVVTSPLVRARATGEAVAHAAGLDRIDTDERLTERCMGSYEGEYIADRPDYFTVFDADDGTMEPLADVQKRMVAALRGLAKGSGPVVAVSHGAALNALLTEVSGGLVGTGITRLVNCCINVIGLDEADGTLALLAYNLPPDELHGWANKQGADVLDPHASNLQRIAALKTPVVPPEGSERAQCAAESAGQDRNANVENQRGRQYDH